MINIFNKKNITDKAMSKLVSHYLIKMLWDDYMKNIPDLKIFDNKDNIIMDHFALIILDNNIRKNIQKIFEKLGFIKRGEGYLEKKQNYFLWMVHGEHRSVNIRQLLPQLVLADFSFNSMPKYIVTIIKKHLKPQIYFAFNKLNILLNKAVDGNIEAAKKAALLIYDYLQKRHWELPGKQDFHLIEKYNKLIAWVLVSGIKVNHFGIAVHLMNKFTSIKEINNHLVQKSNVKLNNLGGEVKGSIDKGIEQSAIIGRKINYDLQDKKITIQGPFMEFIWRFAKVANPDKYEDYYNNFLTENADDIITSVYEQTSNSVMNS